MDMQKYVFDTLKDIGVPVSFVARGESHLPLIVFNVTQEKGDMFWDDEETVILKEKMLEKNENGIQDVMEYLKKVLIESGIALVSYFSFDSDVQPDNN